MLEVRVGEQTRACRQARSSRLVTRVTEKASSVACVLGIVFLFCPSKAQAEEPRPETRTEVGAIPALGYDSNTGVGVGAIVNIARIEPHASPYAWRARFQTYLTFQDTPEGLQLPLHDHYVDIDEPGLLDGRLRLTVRLGYFRNSQLGYYGLGGASERDENLIETDYDHYYYTGSYPYARLTTRYLLAQPLDGRLEAFARTETLVHETTVPEGSKLESDLNDPDPVTARNLHGTGNLFRSEVIGGLAFDTRDNEIAPESGMFHDISLRGGIATVDKGAYVGGNATTRFYQAIVPRYAVLAGRFGVDVLHGEPPLRELSRMSGLYSKYMTGGHGSVRGVIAQRYRGRGKLLLNTELRSRVFSFPIGSGRFDLGALAYFDAGRVWAEGLTSSPLDDGAGFFTGTGGGLRVHWGEAFIIRADYGYSPSEGTSGLYLDIMHIF